MKGISPLRRRFIVALSVYICAVLFLWLSGYHIAYRAAERSAVKSAILAAENLTGQIGAEFAQMKTIASAIAGSAFVQDFLKERDVSAYYEKAGMASEIIQKAAFPITSADSVIAINAEGDFYRFSGGLSNDSCEALYKSFQGAGTVYTVAELDGTLFFCHSTPVFDTSGRPPARVGSIVMLTGLEKARRMLDHENTGIDMAVLLSGKVILAGDLTLEGAEAAELSKRYGVVSSSPVNDTPLTVAAAIPQGALFPESRLFLTLSVIMLCLLLAVLAILYRYLSGHIVQPMANILLHVREVGGGKRGHLPETGRRDFDVLVANINDMLDRTERYNTQMIAGQQKLFQAEILKQKMRMSLLTSQMDAHFVVNTLGGIKRLAEAGKNDKAAKMAGELAVLLSHRHTGDELVSVFAEMDMLQKYIDIMNIRFDGKFSVAYELDDALDACLIPGMMLQPIVENALHHGLQSKEIDARLVIEGTVEDERIRFEFSDNGAGIPPAKLKAIRATLAETEVTDFPAPGLHGVALANIQRRIFLRFGEEYALTIESDWGKGTTVTMVLPRVADE